MIPTLTEATIRSHTSPKSFDRGQDYYQSGSVGTLIQRGNVLSAKVEGSEVEPYRVTIYFDPGGITHAHCSCPFDYGGWCKHIVAILLTCLYQPEQVEQRPELTQLLAALNREQLQTMLQTLATEDPEWAEAIEDQVFQLTQPQPQKNQAQSRRTSVDPKPIERQVERIIDRYFGEWNDDPALDEIRDLMRKGDDFLEQGDGDNALIIMGAITRAYVRDWVNLDGSSGESGIFFEELDDAITETILSAELSAKDHQQWQRQLNAWRTEVEDYGIDSFEMSLAALAQGWHYPPLQQILTGETTEPGSWKDPSAQFFDDLVCIRLKILERQGKTQDYLYLAQAAGQTDRYLQMLAQLGRTEEAIAQAQQQMQTADEAFTLAQALREQGKLEQALNIATQGLSLSGQRKYQLADWVAELAEGLGEQDRALQARVTAFKAQPSLADYLQVQELAGDQWKPLRQELLAKLRGASNNLHAEAKVAIFLHEGLIDAAIKTVDQLSLYRTALMHSVMDAAIEHRPEWVIESARSHAEVIMDAGQARYYEDAVNWLRKVRLAYCQLGQLEEWQQYRTTLLQTHTRKRKLMSLMQQYDLM